jgi:hypothetical protein
MADVVWSGERCGRPHAIAPLCKNCMPRWAEERAEQLGVCVRRFDVVVGVVVDRVDGQIETDMSGEFCGRCLHTHNNILS